MLVVSKTSIRENSMNNNVFKIRNLDLVFGDDKFHLETINNITLKSGEILGVLGESGCGKSTFGKCLIGLINQRDKERFHVTRLGDNECEAAIELKTPPNLFHLGNVLNGTKNELQKYHKHVQMIFQNPRSTLNLNMPVHKILEEAIRIDSPKMKKAEVKKRIEKIAKKFEIGGDNWKRIKRSKPKDLSGGERRRLGIAKVFATNPDVIIADEPVASLDVSVRGKILKTLYEEWEDRRNEWKIGKRNHPLTIIIISHDFGLLQKMCQRIMVFYGDIHVKRGTVVEVFQNNNIPENLHPYTEKLRRDAKYLSSPENIKFSIDKIGSEKKIEKTSCVYVNRCTNPLDKCFKRQPPLVKIDDYYKACYKK